MLNECPSEGCEIRPLCAELQKLGCGRNASWLGVVLFVRNLIKLFSIFDDVQKEDIQHVIFDEIAQHDPSQAHFLHVIEQLEVFVGNNTITNNLTRQLAIQNHGTNALVEAITEFLQQSFTSQDQRDRLIGRFGCETIKTLDEDTDPASKVQRLRVLVTEMLRHYRDEALSWERKARELERMVHVDSLLAPLHNRRALDKHLEKAVATARQENTPLSVFMIDVDNFKTSINDVYGHQVGDDVLRTLAKIIHGYATQHGWFAARYGGDELVLVCDIGAEKSQLYAEAIRMAVQQYEFHPRIGGRLADTTIRFTISIGVAVYHAGISWQKLLGSADKAMYRVKGTGKNNVLRYGSAQSKSWPLPIQE